jgi:hypothetical protein
MFSKSNVPVVSVALAALSSVYYFVINGSGLGGSPIYENAIVANIGTVFKNKTYSTQSGEEVNISDVINWLQSGDKDAKNGREQAEYILETDNKTLNSAQEISKWYEAWDSIANATRIWVESENEAEREQKWAETYLHHYDYF